MILLSDFQLCPVVLNLGSIEPQELGESVSEVPRQEILSNRNKINKIHDTHFIFSTTKRSMNACMELVGFSTSIRLRTTALKGGTGLKFLFFSKY